MAHVMYADRDLGEITDPAELAYYRREPEAVIDGVPVDGDAKLVKEPTRAELQEQARALGLDDSGTKAVLAQRILDHATQPASEPVEEPQPVEAADDGQPVVEGVEVS